MFTLKKNHAYWITCKTDGGEIFTKTVTVHNNRELSLDKKYAVKHRGHYFTCKLLAIEDLGIQPIEDGLVFARYPIRCKSAEAILEHGELK